MEAPLHIIASVLGEQYEREKSACRASTDSQSGRSLAHEIDLAFKEIFHPLTIHSGCTVQQNTLNTFPVRGLTFMTSALRGEAGDTFKGRHNKQRLVR